jgi:3-oxoacyl-[acyl-carrier protein] reductase
MQKMEGRIAFVTGGSRGLGLAIGRALASAGIDVALGYLTGEREATRAAEELVATFGVRALAVGGDVSNSSQVNLAIETIESNLGAINILVNNAGINPAGPIDTLTESDFDRTLLVNLKSAFLVTQRVLPQMRATKFGRIIMMSSIAAQTGGVIGPHYAASKAGLLGLMHSYASQLANEGITANAIAPALIETDMIKGNTKISADILPVKRFGKPEEVAELVLPVIRNGYVNGQTINVNAGWYHS